MRASLTSRLFAAGLVILSIAATSASAQTTFNATDDAFVRASTPTSTLGLSSKIIVKENVEQLGYGLFDVSSLSGQTVTSATLRFRVRFVGSAGDVTIHPVTSTWSEASITYVTRPTNSGTVLDTVAVSGADANTYVSADVTAVVQGWIDTPASNFGVALLPGSGTNTTLFSKQGGFPLELEVTTGAASNQAPVPNAGADQSVVFGNTVDLLATATDDGLPNPPASLTYAWSQFSGPGTATFTSPSTAGTTVSFDAIGTYQLQVQVSDSEFSPTDIVEVEVTSEPVNQAPTPNAGGDQVINLSDTATLLATATDDGLPNPPAILTYAWSQFSGPGTASFTSAGTAGTDVTFDAVGVYVLEVQVSDSEFSPTDQVQITVNADPVNTKPDPDAGSNQTILLSQSATLLATATDDGLPNPPASLTYAWTQFSGPGTASFTSAATAGTDVSFDTAGVYVLQVEVSDSELSETDTVQITVNTGGGGGTTTLNPIEDTYVKANAATSIFGAANRMFAKNSPEQTSLMLFDLSSLAGQTATSATLRVYLRTIINAGSVAAHEVTSAWSEAATNYNTRPTVSGTVLDTVTVAGGDAGAYIEFDVSAIVQGWIDSPGSNLGVAIQDAGPVSLKFDTRENVNDPELVIDTGAASNQAPVPNAGADQSVVFGNTVDLLATATDDGLPNPPASLTYAWSQFSGPGTATFTSPSTAGTTVSFDAIGTYQLQVQVSDSEFSPTDIVEVEVTSEPVNQAPTPNAGGDQVINLSDTATLLATATDDGLPNPPAILTYAWSQFSGPGTASFTSAGTAGTDVTFDAVGVYVLEVQVSDSEFSPTDQVQITVNADPVNTKPDPDAGSNQTILLSQSATLLATATDDGLPNPPASLTYAWTQFSGPGTASFTSAATAGTDVSFDTAGVYVLQVEVSDSELSETDTVQITVNTGGGGTTDTFDAIADTWVNGAAPGNNYGTSTKILINNSPERIGYSQFDLSSLAGRTVTSATLRIYADFVNSPGPVQAQAVTSAWAETSVTFSSRPTLDAAILDTLAIGAGDTDTYVSLDVTSLVAGWVAGTTTNFGVAVPNAGAINLKLGTRESGFPMQLEVTHELVQSNLAPTADAGPDQSVDEQTLVTLDATGSSDSDGTIDTYAWTQTGGTAVVLSSTTASQPTFTGPIVLATSSPDTLTFQVLVTNNEGATDTNTVSIDVNAVNTNPTASAGPDQGVDEQTLVTLDATGSTDADGTLDTYAWTQTAGTTVALSSTSASQPTFTAPAVLVSASPETLTFQVLVTDNEGGTHADTVDISVTAVNADPTADAGPDQGVGDLMPVTLDATGSTDTDGTVDTYAWTQTAGTVVALSSTSASQPTFTSPSRLVADGPETLTFQVEVTDNEGGTDTDLVDIVVTPVNEDPTADAGADQSVDEQTLVTLDATGSTDSDGTVDSYAWTQTAGTVVALSSTSASQPTFTSPSRLVADGPETLTFEVEVTDNEGGTHTDSVDITVNPVNTDPTADAGPDQGVDEQTLVTLDATGSSDSDGTVDTYAWTQTAGTTVVLSSASASQPTFTAPVRLANEGPETLTFQVEVTDNEGGTHADSVDITVNPVNADPTANAGPDQGVGDLMPVTLDATGSTDTDGTVDTYAWTQTAGTVVALSSTSASQPTFTSPSRLVADGPETLTFQVEVTDNEGGTDTDLVDIVVTPVNEDPTADAGADQSVDEQTLVTLDATGSTDSDGTVDSYAWTQTAGTVVALSSTSASQPTFTSPSRLVADGPETLTFEVEVTDNEGGTHTDSVDITVNPVNTDPTADAGPDQGVDEQTLVTLDATGSSDSDGTVDTYAWTQTAGTTVVLSSASASQPTFTAPVRLANEGPETLTFQVEVTDNEGGTHADSVDITVNPSNIDPVADAGADQGVDEQTLVTLDATGSTDSDGTVDSYAWTQTAGTVVALSSTSASQPTFTSPTRLETEGPETLTFEVEVTDNEGGTHTDSVDITVNPSNIDPVADAGPDQGVDEQTLVTLDATGSSDTDGTVDTHAWTQTAGTTVALSSTSASQPTFTSPSRLVADGPETLTFQVEVTDNEGGTHTDSVDITVNPVNTDPTADAGPDQSVDEQTLVTLDATGSSDTDGTVDSYAWTQTAGTVVALSSTSASQPTFTSPTRLESEGPETLTFQVEVTDNEGGMHTASVDITVNPSNIDPVADAGADQGVDEQTVVTLDATGSSDSDGTVDTYAWTQTAGTTVALSSTSASQPTFTAPVRLANEGPETLTFQVEVTDNEGATHTNSVDITVSPSNINPTADAGADQSVDEQTLVTLDATGSADSDGTVDSYAWTQTAGTVVALSSTSASQPTFTSPTRLETEGPETLTFEVEVTDNEGGTHTDNVDITVNPSNTDPVANAGPNQSVDEQTLVTLDATGSADSDGTVDSYAWTQTAGTVVALSSTSASQPTFTSPVRLAPDGPETLTFQVEVTDNEGGTHTDSVDITVNPSNIDPVANAGPDQGVDEQSVVTLDATGSSDSDGTVDSYAWTQTAGTVVALSSTSATQPSFTSPTRLESEGPETLTFQVEVTDNEGGAHTDSVDITVNPSNTDPVANAGPDQNVDEQSVVTLDATGSSDSDGTIDTYAWTQTAGTVVALSSTSASQPTFTSPVRLAPDGPETLTFQVEVTDNEGATHTDSVDITVNPSNIDPVANAGPDQSVDEQTLVTLDANGSADSDGTVDSYAWTQTAGTVVALSSTSASQPTFTAPVRLANEGPETLTFQVLVTDNESGTHTDTVDITVNPSNTDPVANAGADQSVDEQTLVTLDATGSADSDGTVDTYAWTQTAGTVVALSSTSASQPTFTSPVRLAPDGPETLTFQVEVTDNEGATHTDSVDITVNPSNIDPVAAAGADQSVEEQTLVTLDATGSSDSDGTVDTYAWTQTAGTVVALSSTSATQPTFTSPARLESEGPETLTFQVEVTDNEGGTHTDSVDITVNPSNIDPVANAGPDQSVDEQSVVTLDATGSVDSDGTVDTYAWTQTAGTVVALSSTSASQPTFTSPVRLAPDGPETLTFQVEVTDNEGATHADSVDITVNPSNIDPVANAGPDQSVDEQTLVTLDATGSADSDGTVDTYAWTQTAGMTVALSSTSASQPTFTSPTRLETEGPETLTFQVETTDNEGGTHTDSVDITVNPSNTDPVADAGPDQDVDEQTLVTLDATGSADSDGTVDTYAWTQTAGTVVTLSSTSATQPTFTSPVRLVPDGPEVLTFQVEVTDNEGATHTDSVDITVNPSNIDPVANAGPDQSVDEQTLVTLDATGSADSDGTVDSYAWTQTAGTVVALSSSSASQPTFTSPTRLESEGPETLTFQVETTDNEGGTHTDTVDITVNPSNTDPVANAGADQSVDEQTLVTLDATGSADSDGTVDTYAWTQTAGAVVALSSTSASQPTFTAPERLAPDGPEVLTFQVEVTDNEGATHTDSVDITVNPSNIDPVANAGPDQSVDEQTLVTLDATGSTDSDGTVDSYAWTQTAGTVVALSSTSASQPTFTSPERLVGDGPEVLTFQVETTDNENGTHTDTVDITVNPVNTDPTANAGADQSVDEQTLVTLDATGSADTDGTVDTYAWTQTAGTVVALSSTSATQPTFTSPERLAPDGPETLTFQVEVTDNEGGTHTDSVDITVNPVNADPTADAGPDQSVDEETLVTLDATGSTDSDGTVDTYAWTQTAGTTVVLSSTSASQPTFTAPVRLANEGPETLTFQVETTDNEGGTNTDTVDIIVNPVNTDPTANAGADQSVDEQTLVTLDATGSADTDGTVDTYAWTQTAGTVVALSSTSATQPTFTSPERLAPDGPETLTFQVEVTDNEGGTHTDTVDITVNPSNIDPVANAGADQSVDEQTLVALDATGSTDSDGTVDTYAWTQTAGTTVTLSDVAASQPTFTSPVRLVPDGPETLTFQVEVTDNEGGTHTDSVDITVNPSNIDPVANAGADQTVAEQAPVTLDATGSSDSDGTVDSYAWTQTAGTVVVLSDTAATQPTFTSPARTVQQGPETLTFQVEVTDNEGATHTDTVDITVDPNNADPVADAGADQSVDEQTLVTLDATGSTDSDGTVDTYAWTQTAGTVVSLSSASASQPTFTSPVRLLPDGPETLTFQVEVMDDEGGTGTDTVDITVNPVNIDPVANAGPDQNVQDLELVTLDASGSTDSDGTVDAYSWTQTAGSIVVLSDASAIQPTFTAPSRLESEGPETLTFQVEVTDNDATTHTDTVDIVVTPLNEAPDADAGPDQSIDEQTVTTLDATGSTDTDGTVDTYAWTQTAGTTVTLDNPTASQPTFTAPQRLESEGPEVLTFQVEVTDNEGGTNTDTVDVTVNPVNAQPIANAGADQSVDEQTAVQLDASASDDPDSGAASGVYEFQVQVSDGELVATDRVIVDVRDGVPANLPPTADAGADQQILPGASASLLASGSDDGMPAPPASLTYAWTQFSGPGVATFTSPGTAGTNVSFSADGFYELQVEVSDSELSATDIVGVLVEGASGGGTTILNPTADTYSKASVPTNNFGSKKGMFVKDNVHQISYMLFDVSGISGSTVSTATLRVFVENVLTAGTAATRGINATWGEGTLNYNNRPALNGSSTDSHAFMSGDIGTFVEFDVTSLVQGWIDTPASNFGVAIDDAGVVSVKLQTSEAANPPELVVEMAGTIGNTPPLPAAGANQAIPEGASANLTASSTDDGLPNPPGAVTYAWTQFSGPGTASFTSTNTASTTVSFASQNTYLWTQIAGTIVALSDPTAETPTFAAPVRLESEGPETLTFQVAVTDNEGATTTDLVDIVINPVNVPPVSDAGPDQGVLDTTLVTLDGSASSDADGTVNGYAWTQTAGTTVVLSDPAISQPTFTSPDRAVPDGPETLTFDLQVTDDEGATHVDTVDIVVSPNNVDPVANAGADQAVDEQTLVTLDATLSADSDGTIAGYAWTQTAGTVVTLSSTIAVQPTFTAPVRLENLGPETLTFQVGVTDNEGGTHTDTVDIVVNPVNVDPVASAGTDQVVDELTLVTLDATLSTDSDGTVDVYAWTQTAGSVVTLSDAGATQPTFTAPAVLQSAGPETLTFQVEVTDNEGETHTDTVDITVNPINVDPVANAGPDQSVDELTVVTLDATGSTDSDGTVDVFAWTQTAGTVVTLSSTAASQPTFTAPARLIADGPETLTFQVEVTDNEGATHTDTVDVVVNPTNTDPVANAGADQSVDEETLVTLDATASADSDGTIDTYAWTQTAGTTMTLSDTAAIQPTFTGPTRLVADGPEVLSFQVEVTDNEGASHTDSVDITINPANADPVADAGPDQGVDEQTLVTLDATASADTDGTVDTYAWTQTAGTVVVLSDTGATQPTFTAPLRLENEGPEVLTFQVEVTDNEGGTNADTVDITVNPVNGAPVADAGPDQNVNELTLVTLDATASSDTDGSIVTYAWTQTAGTTVSLSDPAASQPTLTTPARSVALGVETLTFQIEVTDDEGATHTDTVDIFSTPVNDDPVAAAGADQNVDEQSLVSLDGTGSTDSDGAVPGVYELQVQVSDSEYTATDRVTIHVAGGSGNLPPAPDAGADQTLTSGSSASLTGSATDDGLPAPSTLTYGWAQFSGPGTATFTSPGSASTNVSFSADGYYELQLAVSDGEHTSTDIVAITIEAGGTGATVNPTGDTYVKASQATTNFGNKVGMFVKDNVEQLSYMDFDISSVTGTTVQSATLRAYVTTVVTAGTVTSHAITSSWNEGSTTYNTRPTYDGTATDSLAITSGDLNGYVEFDVTSIVQDWINSPASNFGIALSHSGVVSIKFETSEAANPPELVVVMTGGGSGNTPPTASAGADQSLVGVSEAVLAATGSDDGLPNPPAAVTYSWSKVSGPGAISFSSSTTPNTIATVVGDLTYLWTQTGGTTVTLNDPTLPQPTFTAPTRLVQDGPETLIFQLQVSDGDGGSHIDTVEVVVAPSNLDPVADAGPDQSVEDQDLVTLDATASADSDGSIATYAWTQTLGPAVTLSDAAAQQPTFTAPNMTNGGTLTFEVEVTDNEGATATDAVDIVVAANTAPTLASIGSRFVEEGATLAFNVSATDVEGPTDPSLQIDDSGLPSSASFTDNGNGTGSFSWTAPAASSSASPYVLVVTAVDPINPGLADSEFVLITVRAAGANTGPFEPDGSGQLSIEAESFDANVIQNEYQWMPYTATAGYSGSMAMQSLPEDNVNPPDFENDSARMDYQASFDSSGTYTVCLLGLGPASSSNSIHIGINNDGGTALAAGVPTGGTYSWVEAGTISIPTSGVHQVNIWMRESGTVIDKFVLKPTAGCAFAGTGPAESTRSATPPLLDTFSDGNSDGWAITNDAITVNGSWSVVAGTFQQGIHTSSTHGKDFDGTYHLGSQAILTESLGRGNYRYSVTMTPQTGNGDDIGVVFRWVDVDNHYRFALNSEYGFARLEKRVNGTFTTLKRNARGYLPGASIDVEVEVDGSLIQVFVDGDPLFAVFDSSHATGGIGLFSRDAVRFDDVLVQDNTSVADIVIATPVAHDVIPGGAQNIDVVAIARNVPSPLGSVEIQADLSTCGAPTESPPGVYTSTCSNVQPGDHVFEAIIKNAGIEIVRDSNVSVAVASGAFGNRLYDAIGDSITVGLRDNYALDNLTLTDQRSLTFQGWPSLVADLLTDETGGVYPNLVINEGVRGDRSDDILNTRLASIIERNPNSDGALLLLGTNGTNPANATPNGSGCVGAACDGTYKGNMLEIISGLQAAGRNTIYVALLPPAWGNGSSSAPYANPLTGNRNAGVDGTIAFNSVIQNELVTLAGVEQGPDFFSCFLTATTNRFSLFVDNLHPNALGYAVMAHLWADWIANGPFTLPQDPCPPPFYILEDVSPSTYKQNLLEIGDEMYNDETFIFTSMPSEFEGGIWVMPDNADVADSSSSLVTFDSGSTSATVYIAYDPAGSPPTSSSDTFTAYTPSSNLTATGGPVTQYAFVRATNVNGTVTLGGSQSGGAGAQSSYLVIVQP